jgi:pimeloyl-ACP methyl ester carboxylesterase
MGSSRAWPAGHDSDGTIFRTSRSETLAQQSEALAACVTVLTGGVRTREVVMRHKLILATSVAGAVILAGTVAPTAASAAPAAARAAAISWGACSDSNLQDAGAQCGFLSVPLDYSHPNGTKIKIAVSRVKHTVPDSQYQGVMLVNPGGPGGSGLDLATLGSAVPNNVGASYDWIGFDPRGVGSSQPELSCIPDYFGYDRPFYIPVEQQDLQAWLHRLKAYAQACGANGGDLLNHMTTIDSARDMDSIRAALGRKQINYYGFSYGTYLGQVYATLFPSHLRRAVFDSNVDPSRIWYQANLDQDIAFNRNIKIWFGWVAKYNSVYHLGATEQAVEALFYKIAIKLRSQPILGKIGFDEWMDTFLYAGYYQFFWVPLGNALAGYVNANQQQQIVDLYDELNDPTDDNGYAVYNAVQCTDVQWPKDWSTWSRDNWRVFAIAPFETWGNAWFNAPCLYWPAKAHTPVTVDGSKVARRGGRCPVR